MLSARSTSGHLRWFLISLGKFRSFNSHSDLENGKLVNVVIVSNSNSTRKWPNTKLGPIDTVNPKFPLPGFVGVLLNKDEKAFEKMYAPAVHTLPPMKEEHYASLLLNIYHGKEFNESDSALIPRISDQFECTIQTCPMLIQQTLADLFPSKKLSSKPLTVCILSHSTNEFFNLWSEEAVNEREQLAWSFITSAIEICVSLKESGYWADFIDPFSGKPYLGTHGAGSSVQLIDDTDETMKHFGFELDNSMCCKILRHPKWKNHVFVGLIFTNAPDSHPVLLNI
ncbi:unnamed protein product [Schistosoma turkestanicum]|nr:unnamed protein product [Schistosoma turkestanicum]